MFVSDEWFEKPARLLSPQSLFRTVSINVRTSVVATRVVGLAQVLRVNERERRPPNSLV